MTNEEFVAEFGNLYGKIMDLKKDSDYVVNRPQMDKMISVLDFFMSTAKKLNGRVKPVRLVPREEHGGVTASFIVFDIYGDDVKKFCDVMRHASAIGIDSMKNGEICIAVTIPNIFVRK